MIAGLENDYVNGAAAVCEPQRLLLALELIGDSIRPAFAQTIDHFLAFCLAPIRLEETVVLLAAQKMLTAAD